MSYSFVLQVQNMWECDYKLLKAKKEQLIAVTRDHHSLDSRSKTAQMGCSCYRMVSVYTFMQPHSSKYFHKYTSCIQ